MDAKERLSILADASRYDLACACGTTSDDHRTRTGDGRWLYPASVPRGGRSILLKTLLSNSCVNDCLYCPLRSSQDVPRCSLEPEETAGLFMEYVRRLDIFGLFLSSGVVRDPDHAMDRMLAVARLLRSEHRFRGYLHLKILPGASDAAIEDALSMASAVSVNVEVPKASHLKLLSQRKDFERDIVRPIKLISRWTGPGARFARVKQTTQFIVGAAGEKDEDIVKAVYGLYHRWGLSRAYFSAYQRGLGDASLPGERGQDLLTREHRLYQAEFLIRKYGWEERDILFQPDGNLALDQDPKEVWARRHPEFFPVRLLSARREELLRVPGIGPTLAGRILQARRHGTLRGLEDVGLRGSRLQKTAGYVVRS